MREALGEQLGEAGVGLVGGERVSAERRGALGGQHERDMSLP